MKHKPLKWLLYSQSSAILGSSLVFPFYLLFIKDIGASYGQFGLSYGLFTLSSAFVHLLIGKYTGKMGSMIFLALYSFGMSLAFLLLPVLTALWQVYTMQIFLGALGAVQKTSEKIVIADLTSGYERGQVIGHYHFWTTIFSAFAIITGGYLADLLTVDVIFYIGAVSMFASSLLTMKLVNT
ncbi:MFS transporter [Priestia abyssalis]|uniref:MFS transporter n=1 Tax=Priestia abyssalis TaxID=1221450 RepID=UPI00099546E2